MKSTKLISLIVTGILVFGSITPFTVCAAPSESTSIEDSSAEGDAIYITSENIEEVAEMYQIPKEVVQYLESKLSTTNRLYLSSSSTIEDGTNVSPNSISTSWETQAPYGGYNLKDWVVTEKNAFGMTPIASAAGGANVLSFCESVLCFAAGKLADSFSPFGSALVTLGQFALGLQSNDVYPTSGDKAEAAPMYTLREIFTYVETPDGDVLGCRTSSVRLESIAWYAYYAEKHLQNTEIRYYSNKMYESENYSNRRKVAVQYFAAGGHYDQPVRLEIGDASFVFQ